MSPDQAQRSGRPLRPAMLTLLLVLLALTIAACGGQETPTPEPTPQPAPTETAVAEVPTEVPPTAVPPTEVPPTEEPILATMAHVPDPELIDVTWQWEERESSSGAPEITVANPEAYTIVFNADGTFAATLDCNSAGGQYATPEEGSIFMELGPMTLAECGPDSLADQMVAMFGPAQEYRFEEDGQVLVFTWAAGGAVDYYRHASGVPGEAEVRAIPADAIEMELGELADSFAWSVRPAIPIPPGPGGQGFPPHILLTFDGESAEEVLANNGRRLYIFPTQAYIDLYEAQGNSIVGDQVARLEELIAEADGREAIPDSPMPILPPPSSFMNRWAQFADLNFGVGNGVRFVSESPNRQDTGPWTNMGTAYTYEGLTSDGNFVVSLFWPVSTENLPDTPDDVPEDVVAQATDPGTYREYLQTTIDMLNELPTSAWEPDLVQLDAMIESLTFPTAVPSGLTGETWQWVSLTSADQEIAVDDPSRYTIVFNEDGTADIKADCNNVGATYTAEGSSLGITLGPSTRVACPEDSLDEEYLAGLGSAAAFAVEDGELILELPDGGTMSLAIEPVVEGPAPSEGEATATITAPDGIYIRSGPGTSYPPIGTIPVGESRSIVGRSEDGQWWVIALPEAPGVEGWISAEFVEATNAGDVPVVAPPSLEAGLTLTTWQWASLSSAEGETTVNNPTRYTIQFNSDGTAAIKADCNNVGATYTTEGSNISINLGPSTLAACPEDSLDQQFLESLGSVSSYSFQDSDLILELAEGAGTMRLTPSGAVGLIPAPAPELPLSSAQGVLFQLMSFGLPNTQQPVLPGTQITATFSDTEVSGSAGCNEYTGQLTPVDDYFTIGPIALTQKACSEPAGIMEQEQAYLTALEATDGFEWVSRLVEGTRVITGGRLTYTLPDGTEGIINYLAP